MAKRVTRTVPPAPPSMLAVPELLRDLYHKTTPGEIVEVFSPPQEPGFDGQNWPNFSDLATGAGFTPLRNGRSKGNVAVTKRFRREHTLTDTVKTHMRLLVCGLNPSPSSADSGVGFHRAGNRFWPAALAAGLVSVDRDPVHALQNHGMGMTDLVKRTTRKASELDPAEYISGLERLERLVRWLQPSALCFVGLAGWRAALDKKAKPGAQERTIGGRPVYLMPSTSGLNASSQLPDLTEHFQAALTLSQQKP